MHCAVNVCWLKFSSDFSFMLSHWIVINFNIKTKCINIHFVCPQCSCWFHTKLLLFLYKNKPKLPKQEIAHEAESLTITITPKRSCEMHIISVELRSINFIIPYVTSSGTRLFLCTVLPSKKIGTLLVYCVSFTSAYPKCISRVSQSVNGYAAKVFFE